VNSTLKLAGQAIRAGSRDLSIAHQVGGSSGTVYRTTRGEAQCQEAFCRLKFAPKIRSFLQAQVVS